MKRPNRRQLILLVCALLLAAALTLCGVLLASGGAQPVDGTEAATGQISGASESGALSESDTAAASGQSSGIGQEESASAQSGQSGQSVSSGSGSAGVSSGQSSQGTQSTAKPSSSGGQSGSSSASTASQQSGAASSSGTLTLAQQNAQRISALYSQYHVTVQTGDAAGVWQGGTLYGGLTDPTLIAEWLDVIEGQIRRYPAGFFSDLSDISPQFKIKLVATLPGKAGFASYELADDMHIGLNAQTDSLTRSRTLNHEIMHIIERYIYFKTWEANPLYATQGVNPADSFGTSGNSFTIYSGAAAAEQYFVSAYAKTNGVEDRAETFTDYMFRPYRKTYMQQAAYPIPRKMRIIADAIRTYFPSAARSAQGSLPWEQLLV